MSTLARFGAIVSVLITALWLLGLTGRGFEGEHLVYFFAALTALFSIVYLFDGRPRTASFFRFQFEIEVVMLIATALVWISLFDYYLVETFKTLAFDFGDNTYWVVLFSGFAPMIFVVIALSFFIGTYHIAHTVRIIVLSVYLLNANINDLLYYKLFGQPFPSEWPWLYQPRFLFGEQITTPELFVWVAVASVMGLVAFAFPYERLVPSQFEYKKDGGEKRARSYELTILVIFFVFSFIYAHQFTQGINESLERSQHRAIEVGNITE